MVNLGSIPSCAQQKSVTESSVLGEQRIIKINPHEQRVEAALLSNHPSCGRLLTNNSPTV